MDIKAKRQRAANTIYILTAVIIVAVIVMSLIAALSGANKRGEDKTTDKADGEVTTVAPSKENEVTLPLSDHKPETKPIDKEEGGATDVGTKDTADVSASNEFGIPVYAMPVNGIISKGYDEDMPVYSLTMGDYRVHTGIDIMADVGSAVCACSDGVISAIYDDPYMGQCIEVDHGGGIVSRYAGVSSTLAEGIEVGSKVVKGQLMTSISDGYGIEMSDEPHLHFEILLNGVKSDPLIFIPYSESSAVFNYED
ncbi:MAG: M23 family metallopeptidase [Clostridia bacterium]|jgi:murein DD-endopeptidase MepM/ murein hydrolase activator NlpD|nr:M23 family metallopeptidase [Clostridia bacterium]